MHDPNDDDVVVEINTGGGIVLKFLQFRPTSTVKMTKQEMERTHGIAASHAHLFVHDEHREEELQDPETIGSLQRENGVIRMSLLVIEASAQQVVPGLLAEPDRVFGAGSDSDSGSQLSNPQGIAFVPNQNWLAITEYADQSLEGGRVKICDVQTGKLICKFGDGDGHTGQLFNGPMGVAITLDSTLVLVANLRNHNVQVLKLHTGGEDGPKLTFVRSFGHERLNGPAGLALLKDSTGQETVLVTDARNTRVSHFSLDGTFLRTFTTCLDYMYSGPRAIAVIGSAEVAIANCDLHCVQVFDSEGNFTREFGKAHEDTADTTSSAQSARAPSKTNDGGVIDGELFHPVALASDDDGNVLVLDKTTRLQVFSPEGDHLCTRGDFGLSESCNKGIAWSAASKLAIANGCSNNAMVWSAVQ
jgi:DNA-binding beta-propeller fold protein YncE